MSDVIHGNTGYRRGCRCETCRAHHAAVAARWREKRKTAALADADGGAQAAPSPPPAPRDPLALPPTIDLAADPGAIERAFEEDLAADSEDVLWKRTLLAMGRLNARLLDQIDVHGRLDIVSPVQLRTLEILNRLAYLKVNGLTGVSAGAPGAEKSDEQLARELLEGIGGG